MAKKRKRLKNIRETKYANKRRYFCTSHFLLFSTFTLVLLIGTAMYTVPNLTFHFPSSTVTPDLAFLRFSKLVNKTSGQRNSKQAIRRKQVHYYEKPGWLREDVFDTCDSPCYFTFGKDIEPLEADTAVVFHAPDIDFAPLRKKPGQIWIFHSMESPDNHHKEFLKFWKGLFNWTIGYRRDADILSPYSVFRQRSENITQNGELSSEGPPSKKTFISKQSWRSKARETVWFVSKCETPSLRNLYALRLGRFVNIDVFGNCGKFLCPRRQEHMCQNFMRKWYKFYLGFENSLCVDYITEKNLKLYETLLDLIPVSRSQANLSMYLPPGSYIKTTDFQTIQSLGDFLKEISVSYGRFNDYFKWKRYYKNINTIDSEDSFCELCRRLHSGTEKYKRLYDDIEFWLSGNGTMCSTVVEDVLSISNNK